MGDVFISKLSPGRAQMYRQEQGITHQNLHKQVIYHRRSIKPWNGGDRGVEKRTLVEKNREGQGERDAEILGADTSTDGEAAVAGGGRRRRRRRRWRRRCRRGAGDLALRDREGAVSCAGGEGPATAGSSGIGGVLAMAERWWRRAPGATGSSKQRAAVASRSRTGRRSRTGDGARPSGRRPGQRSRALGV